MGEVKDLRREVHLPGCEHREEDPYHPVYVPRACRMWRKREHSWSKARRRFREVIVQAPTLQTRPTDGQVCLTFAAGS